MVDSFNFKELEKLTDTQRIDSHNSQLTNLRIHAIEIELDQWRIHMCREPTQENIIGCFAVIKSWFSYMQSIDQSRKNPKQKKDNNDVFRTRVEAIGQKIGCVNNYVLYIQKRIVSEEINKVFKELGTRSLNAKFWNKVESNMMLLVNEIIDDMRTMYQGMNFYFRTSKDNGAIGGILGDLVNAKKGSNKSVEVPNEPEG